eukprot:5883940-Pleurochrysis_carterae.AAC.3
MSGLVDVLPPVLLSLLLTYLGLMRDGAVGEPTDLHIVSSRRWMCFDFTMGYTTQERGYGSHETANKVMGEHRDQVDCAIVVRPHADSL